MILKNTTIIFNYLSCITKFEKNLINLRILSQNLILKNQIKSLNKKSFCLYTYRYRSIYRSFKMSRYKLKNFLDNRSIFNVYAK
jgi:ribosomal protein S14